MKVIMTDVFQKLKKVCEITTRIIQHVLSCSSLQLRPPELKGSSYLNLPQVAGTTVSLFCPGWSTMVQSSLTATPASWIQEILGPLPPKQLGIQVELNSTPMLSGGWT
ncbi:uncharacterized protein LOC128929846 isoform X2 [Callithrix jacchus]